LTTAHYTFEITRYGSSGPDNEKRIEKFIQELIDRQNPKDKYLTIAESAGGFRDFGPTTESVE